MKLRAVSCGRCGARPKAGHVESYAMSRPTAAAAVAHGLGVRNADGSVTLGPEALAYAPEVELWRWPCRCGADWRVRLTELRARLEAGQRVVLGVDLG